MPALFRPEAVEARARHRLGEVSLAQPPGAGLLATLAVGAVVLVLAWLATGEYTHRSRVAGQLVPDRGLATLAAPEAGTVLEVFAAEGTAVTRNAPLVVVATARVTQTGGDTTAALLARLDERRRALLARYASGFERLDAQAAGARRELAAARRELAQVEASIALGERRLEIAGRVRDELRALAERHFVSRLELARQEQAVLEHAAAQRSLERLAASVERDIVALERHLAELGLQRRADEAARASALAELEAERLRVAAAGEALLAAPVAGSVASVLVEPGQPVRDGQALVTLVPAGSRLQARLLVPSRAVGFLEPGDEVRLRYPAFPHAKFGHHAGTVVAISGDALAGRTLAELTGIAAATEPAWRVLVDLERQYVEAYGERRPLKPGMLVEADILGERRRLAEWLLEPLYAVSGRL